MLLDYCASGFAVVVAQDRMQVVDMIVVARDMVIEFIKEVLECAENNGSSNSVVFWNDESKMAGKQKSLIRTRVHVLFQKESPL